MKQLCAIIRSELWQRRWSLLWWSVGVAALVGIDMLLYASVKDQAQQLNELTNRLPSAFKALFSGGVDFLSPVGFLSARIYYLLLPLLLGIFAIGLGSSLIGKEEQRGTLELLLARPVSRTKVLIAKLLAGGVCMLILAVVATVTALLCLSPSGLTGISNRSLVLVNLTVILLSSLFGAISFALVAMGRPARSAAVGVASLLAFGGYIMASLESTVHWLGTPAKLLPYHYYRPADILGGLDNGGGPMLGFAIAILLLCVLAWLGFRRRDIM